MSREYTNMWKSIRLLLLATLVWCQMVAAAPAAQNNNSSSVVSDSPSSERLLLGSECVTDAGCPTAALPFCAVKKTKLGYTKECSECRTSQDCPADSQPCDPVTKTCRGPRLVPTITALVRFQSLTNVTDEDGDVLCKNILSSIYVPNGICRVDGILEGYNGMVVSIYSYDDSVQVFDSMTELLSLLTSNSLELRDALSENLEQFGLPSVTSSSYEMVLYSPKAMSGRSMENLRVPTVVSTAFASLSCSSRAHISWLPATPAQVNPTYIAYIVVCSSSNTVVAKSVPGYRIDTSIDLPRLNETYTCEVASVTLESSMSAFTDAAPFIESSSWCMCSPSVHHQFFQKLSLPKWGCYMLLCICGSAGIVCG